MMSPYSQNESGLKNSEGEFDETITASQLRQSHLRNKRTDSYVPDDPNNQNYLPFTHQAYGTQ